MYDRRAISLVAAPYAEPIHLTEAKLHLKVEHEEDDDLIAVMISAARQQAEAFLNLQLCAATYDLFFDGWPYDEIKIPRAPLRSVTFIKYVDGDGATQTLDAAKYTVDINSRPGRIVPAYGQYWPVSRCQPNSIQIRFVAGEVTPFTAASGTPGVVTPKGRAFANNDVFRLSNSGGALPAGLSPSTDYYVVGLSGATFNLAATQGGAAINLTTGGLGTQFIGELSEAIRSMIKLALTDLYENRNDATAGKEPSALRTAFERLGWPDRILPV